MLEIRKPSYRGIRQAPSKKPRGLDYDIDLVALEFNHSGAIKPDKNRGCKTSRRLTESSGLDNLHRRQFGEFGQLPLIGVDFRKHDRNKTSFLMRVESDKKICQVIESSRPCTAGNVRKRETEGS